MNHTRRIRLLLAATALSIAHLPAQTQPAPHPTEIKQATGSYPLAMLPLAGLSAAGAVAILLIDRGRKLGEVLTSEAVQSQR